MPDFSSVKMHQMFKMFRPRPCWGSLQHSTDSLAVFGKKEKRREKNGGRGERRRSEGEKISEGEEEPWRG